MNGPSNERRDGAAGLAGRIPAPMRAAMLGLLLVGLGCRVGTWDQDSLVSGRGAVVDLSVAEESVRGELLVVEETGLLLLSNRGLTRTPWDAVRRLRSRDPREELFREGDPVPPASLEEMRLRSRYPYGLTDEQLSALLAHEGLESVEELR